MSKIWTPQELEFLEQFYPETSVKYCAEQLGRSLESVSCKAFRLGLKAPHTRNPYNKKTHEQYENELFEKEIDLLIIEEYKGKDTPVKHECFNGHEWIVRPHDVLQGRTCPSCNQTSGFDRTKPAIFYYIKIIKDNETYYKVGVTNRNVHERYSMDRDKEIIPLVVEYFDSGIDAIAKEQYILNEFSDLRTNINGFLKSGGNTELFEVDILGRDI